jgi:hypothetical protein
MRDGLLQEAMRALSPSALWKMRGWAGVPSKSCHWPNDTDRKKAACSIFTATTGKHAGCELLKDHRQGKSWDAAGLLAEVEGISLREACRLFIELAGVKPLDAPGAGNGGKRSKSAPAAKPVIPPREESPPQPPFDFRALNPRDLDADDIEGIATTRDVSPRTVESLARWGVIHAVTLTANLRLPIPRQSLPMPAWALHSPSWDSFRLRPFCGLFPGFEGGRHKSLTPTGASCANPVWIGPEHAPRVLIVEGEGDAIGAVEIARRERKPDGLAVVVMFSSSIGIPSSFLSRFEGRRVRIVPHIGDSKRQGEVAAVRWSAVISHVAAEVHIFSLAGISMPDGGHVGDLGDLARCSELKGVTTW